jgi:hypothetical protein
MVTLKTWSPPTGGRQYSLPHQASLRLSAYDDDTSFKLDIDIKARQILKRAADDDHENQ